MHERMLLAQKQASRYKVPRADIIYYRVSVLMLVEFVAK
jgi:hypothetical protein